MKPPPSNNKKHLKSKQLKRLLKKYQKERETLIPVVKRRIQKMTHIILQQLEKLRTLNLRRILRLSKRKWLRYS
jgi:hypothetical protein